MEQTKPKGGLEALPSTIAHSNRCVFSEQMHWNNRNFSLYFYIKKIGSLTLVRIFCVRKKGLIRKALKLYVSIRKAKNMSTHFCGPQYLSVSWYSPDLGEARQGLLHQVLLRSVPCTGITQGTVYSLVLMTPWALPPCGALLRDIFLYTVNICYSHWLMNKLIWPMAR